MVSHGSIRMSLVYMCWQLNKFSRLSEQVPAELPDSRERFEFEERQPKGLGFGLSSVIVSIRA
jgi:hypothetical protein